MAEQIQAPPGMFDILPKMTKDLWQDSALWYYVENTMRHMAKLWGFEEIRTPILERTELFKRSSGETSDVVAKELYTFEDRGGRSLSLRPEGTASVIRAFNEHSLAQKGSLHKLFYLASMFRYDRPQAGRYRQHHQFGAEVIGYGGPEQDVEVIDLLLSTYKKLGLQNLTLHINSLGTAEDRTRYKEALVKYLTPKLMELSEDSQRRLTTNPLRILDSKDPKDHALLEGAPSLMDALSPESKARFDVVCHWLTNFSIPYKITPDLVRGLDYYNHTVFEVVAGTLGAQNSIGGGGRYDGLMEALGGKALPCFGFGTGIERIIQTMLAQGVEIPKVQSASIMFIPLGEKAKEAAAIHCHQLRLQNIFALVELTGRKLGKAIESAEAQGVRYINVIGDNELTSNEIELKELSTKNIVKLSWHQLESFLKEPS